MQTYIIASLKRLKNKNEKTLSKESVFLSLIKMWKILENTRKIVILYIENLKKDVKNEKRREASKNI